MFCLSMPDVKSFFKNTIYIPHSQPTFIIENNMQNIKRD